ncbi:hypothetical protein Tco_0899367 [Tanacetum coccineum]
MHESPFFFHLIEVFTISGYVTSGTEDVKMFERRFSAIDDVIWCLFMSGDDQRSVLSVFKEWKFDVQCLLL